MKKQKAKKAGGAKKKEEKTEAPAEAEAEASTAAETTEEKPEDAAPAPVEATSTSPGPVEDDDEPSELPAAKPSHGRKPSVAVESRQRSESFYRSGVPTSPSPVTAGGGITSEVYREQAQKIEELERENKRLADEVEEHHGRWKKGEEELEELRESRGDVALAAEKGKEADNLVRLSRYEFGRGELEANIFTRKLKSNRSSANYRRPSRKAQSQVARHRPPRPANLPPSTT